MALLPSQLNYDHAVRYHNGQFPPHTLNYSKLISPLSSASAALARYDQMLRNMHNSEILLAPLRHKEAVISSRIEGTISTLDEALRYEADQEEDFCEQPQQYRNETFEVFLYQRAMKRAQTAIEDGRPLSGWLLRTAHSVLLGFGRRADKSPGEYKDEQNYVFDKPRRQVLFIPISPEQLPGGMERLFSFIAETDREKLIQTAIAHIEFEALHPFKDGNGRIGRMLITLMLWKQGLLAAPHFYISGYFDENRDEYIERMREVSKSGAWTEWCIFFLNAIETQAHANIQTAENIQRLYDEMKETFREALSSKWCTTALDFVFEQPIFRNSRFTHRSGIPNATALRFTRVLVERNLLTTLEPASGRRAALYAFEPLLELVRG